MQTWDAIRARRNIRDWGDQPVPPEQLEQVLEAGRRTPSARNWQPWDMVVVTGKEQLAKLAKVWMGAWHVANTAVTIGLVAPQPADASERDLLQFDLGQLSMSMLLAATDLGIGTGHAAVTDQAMAREILGFPEDRFLAFMIELGYPKTPRPPTPIENPDRRPLDQVVHRERW